MIFVPSRTGVNHPSEEQTSAKNCASDAKVLRQSVVRYDQKWAYA
jgi:hypothetical protein